MTCNGPAKPDASRPFLTPPFQGFTSIVSFVDHDLPNFSRDGRVITATGLAAEPDGEHQAPDFPAYWSPSIRQFVYYDGHNGYDFNLWYQPVYAAAAGKVIFAGWEYPGLPQTGYGQMVMIDHRNGYVTLYGHFSKIEVKRGQRVKRGQELGISGNTGHSSGPHLHFTVFHNCTPTDPYGWAGSGPDPLADYEGESSTYLWVRAPLIVNPLPHWPGMSLLPPTSIRRLLLLRLPPTNGGTGAFTAALRREISTVRRALGSSVRGVRVDPLRGALDITADESPSVLYRLPDVVSVASSDGAADARADLLGALARAALAGHHRRLPLARSPAWSGYLLRWSGRTILVGRGPRAGHVNLALARPGGEQEVERVTASAADGSYAVDLGKMSTSQVRAVLGEVERRQKNRTSIALKPARRPASVSRRAAGGQSDLAVYVVLGILLTCALGAVPARHFLNRKKLDA